MALRCETARDACERKAHPPARPGAHPDPRARAPTAERQARARVGFGAYFNPGKFEDHWVGEYWNTAEQRWILVDAQLDAVQRKTFKVDFDPRDVPRNGFIIAGDAWQQCRAGRADPSAFGLSPINLSGLW